MQAPGTGLVQSFCNRVKLAPELPVKVAAELFNRAAIDKGAVSHCRPCYAVAFVVAAQVAPFSDLFKLMKFWCFHLRSPAPWGVGLALFDLKNRQVHPVNRRPGH